MERRASRGGFAGLTWWICRAWIYDPRIASAPLITRHAQVAVNLALSDTRVVILLGARQVGKSTLLEQVAADERARRRLITLDDQAVQSAAARDPVGFIATLQTPVAIDEIQRVPELMTEIKLRVDRDRTPGQFALTGSTNLLEMKQVKDSLAGRAEYLRLYPFSQGELLGRRETFVDRLANGEFPQITGAPVGRSAYAEMLATGGYPEAQRRPSSRRQRFFESYVDGILERDLASLGDVTDRAVVGRLLRAIGATSATELNVDRLSNSLDTPASTVRRHLELLEMLFLVRRVPAWSSNLLARTIRRPKVYVADTGLLASLVGADHRRVESDLDLGGMFYETFVAMELDRQISSLQDRPQLFHFRDRDRREVDIVLEHRDGSVSAIEVKASATIRAQDFHGLTHLRAKLGERFKAGVLLYSGANTVPFGDRLAAVPLRGLWAA